MEINFETAQTPLHFEQILQRSSKIYILRSVRSSKKNKVLFLQNILLNN